MRSAGQNSSGAGGAGNNPLLQLAEWLTRVLEGSGKLVAVICLTFMFCALLVNVILRYAFGSGIAWAYEIHALLLPWLVGGGIVIASARGRNIAITLLPEMLPDSSRRLLLAIIQMAVIVISLTVLWSGTPVLWASQFQTLSTLGIKQIWGYSSLAYAFVAMSIIGCCEIIALVSGKEISPEDPAEHSLS